MTTTSSSTDDQHPLVAKVRDAPDITFSWFYPFRGLWFFIRHPYLWPLLRARLLPCCLLSLIVLTNLFLWTYLPQVAFLALFQRKGSAWVNGTFLVLSEGAVLVAILFEAFFVDETQLDIFDAIFVEKGLADLVQLSRPVSPDTNITPVKRLGKPRHSAIYAPFSFRQIVEFILFLPLNFIPYVGVPLFLFLTGYRAGPLLHWRYFKLLGLTRKERKLAIRQRRWSYTAFGTVALVLQLIPVLSMLFLLTTAAGSALWAARIELRRRHQVPETRLPRYVDVG